MMKLIYFIKLKKIIEENKINNSKNLIKKDLIKIK